MFRNAQLLNQKLTAVAAAAALLAVPATAQQVLVDDSFADGDRTKTGALDSSWWTSTSSSGIEDNADDGIGAGILGFVTGTSGRGIHTIFDAQTLANDGDKLTASWTYMTPATTGSNRSTGLRIGLFNSLGRNLEQDITASSGTPNALYGDLLDPVTTPGLPGFMMDMDVNLTSVEDDISFRDSTTSAPSGRLMSTTGSFFQLGSSTDDDFSFAPGTQYSGTFSIERNAGGDLVLTGTLVDGGTTYMHTETELAADVDSYDFDMLAFHANSNTFGSSNSPGAADNGLDFSNIKIETNFGGGNDPADLDGDGDVDDADFGIAFAAFTGPNNGPSSNPAADLDGDGDVDDADFGIAFAAFTGPGGAAVPEPTSLALLGLGGLAMMRRRK